MPITVQEALQRTIEHREIFPDEMLSIMRRIMSGEVTPVMIAALTVGLRVKKETIGKIAAAAISPTVSFLTRRPTVSAAIITGVTSPLMIARINDSISS